MEILKAHFQGPFIIWWTLIFNSWCRSSFGRIRWLKIRKELELWLKVSDYRHTPIVVKSARLSITMGHRTAQSSSNQDQSPSRKWLRYVAPRHFGVLARGDSRSVCKRLSKFQRLPSRASKTPSHNSSHQVAHLNATTSYIILVTSKDIHLENS